MKLNWNFQRIEGGGGGIGSWNKIPFVDDNYGYFQELHNRHEVNHNYINYSTMEKWKNLLTLNKVNAFESIYL